ncbi:MAG: COG4315 family predicted lipoprotein [Acidimicrobiales bacterium]
MLLKSAKIAKYGAVLTNSAGDSLYLLSTESSGKLRCLSKACVSAWRPLVVAAHTKTTAGSGVRGKISHVARGSRWQITYNGWPVYTFIGDSRPHQSHGEGVVAFGGTWYLLHSAARAHGATVVKAAAGGGSTTTTTPGGGWG